MTCIIGIEHKGKVYIGADSGLVRGYSSNITRTPKVFNTGKILFGTSGSVRVSQLIEHKLKIPIDRRKNPATYIIADLVPKIRKMLETENCLTEEGMEANIIIGYKGKVYMLDIAFQIIQYAREFIVTGVGEDIALGVLTISKKVKPEERIIEALETITKFEKIVIPPYIIKSI